MSIAGFNGACFVNYSAPEGRGKGTLQTPPCKCIQSESIIAEDAIQANCGVTIMRIIFNMKGLDAASFMQLLNVNTVAFLVSLHEFFTSTARIALLHSCIIPLVFFFPRRN